MDIDKHETKCIYLQLQKIICQIKIKVCFFRNELKKHFIPNEKYYLNSFIHLLFLLKFYWSFICCFWWHLNKNMNIWSRQVNKYRYDWKNWMQSTYDINTKSPKIKYHEQILKVLKYNLEKWMQCIFQILKYLIWSRKYTPNWAA